MAKSLKSLKFYFISSYITDPFSLIIFSVKIDLKQKSAYHLKNKALIGVIVSQETLTGKILRITYHNTDNYFTVAKIEVTPHKGEIAIVGTMPFVQSGLMVDLEGSWAVDARHGKQFSVTKYKYTLPEDPESLILFLSSGVIPGVGIKTAKKMVDHFGPKLLHILDKEPERLHEMSGLGKKADGIKAAWSAHSQYQELSYILLSWGITHKQAAKIFKKWAHTSVEIIQKNPYVLAKEIQGIGFQLADAIARSIGFLLNSPERLDAAIEYFLWEKSTEGHTAPLLEEFISSSAELLQVTKEEVEERVKEKKKTGAVYFFTVKEEQVQIQLRQLHYLEESIASECLRIKGGPSPVRSFDIEKALAWAEEKTSLQLHPIQREACHMSLSHPISIITGGPGTGKSTILRIILMIFERLSKKIILAAPTGKAAKRMQEITGKFSKTIHRLLRYDPSKNTFEYTNINPLPADLIVIDEASMLDTSLSHHLMKAIPTGAKVIIVGDVNQLPSIGPGMVLQDLIATGQIATTKLTEVFRQAKRSQIIQSAHHILQGEIPSLKNWEGSDFLFFPANEAQEAQTILIDLAVKKIPETYGFDPRNDIQVLAPMKKGEIGCDMLNTLLQNHFSPNKPVSGKGNIFVVGDKVMQIKNNYQKDVYNGDVGWVEWIDQEMGVLRVSFDDHKVEYSTNELEELSLAWAVSVHKYQGSEIPCVIIPVHTQHFKLLNRNLLYTAVTRGKKLVVLVGSVKAIAIAVKQQANLSRWTGLTHRFQNQI